jgi:hypothetical protein
MVKERYREGASTEKKYFMDFFAVDNKKPLFHPNSFGAGN